MQAPGGEAAVERMVPGTEKLEEGAEAGMALGLGLTLMLAPGPGLGPVATPDVGGLVVH